MEFTVKFKRGIEIQVQAEIVKGGAVRVWRGNSSIEYSREQQQDIGITGLRHAAEIAVLCDGV